jgi:glycerol-3-phosphate dehydrogenase (NAD(P)+)
MTQKDFWSKSKVALIGGGSFGTVLAQLLAKNALEVRMWVRTEEHARAINATRTNPDVFEGLVLAPNVKAFSDAAKVFEGGVQAVIWALPSSACREQARNFAPLFTGEEILLHATKGIEEGTLKRISEVLREEIPCPRIGVISGPNLAAELARGEPAATVVASNFDEVAEAGRCLLSNDRFRVYTDHDMIGVEWAGTLKNILAIASGALDALKLGWNARALLITRGLAEIVRFGEALGAKSSTFLGLAGMGDLLATCSSPLSRNYRVGFKLAQGEKLEKVIQELGAVAEGVRTVTSVRQFALEHEISMPITEAVYNLLQNDASVEQILHQLMTR